MFQSKGLMSLLNAMSNGLIFECYVDFFFFFDNSIVFSILVERKKSKAFLRKNLFFFLEDLKEKSKFPS